MPPGLVMTGIDDAVARGLSLGMERDRMTMERERAAQQQANWERSFQLDSAEAARRQQAFEQQQRMRMTTAKVMGALLMGEQDQMDLEEMGPAPSGPVESPEVGAAIAQGRMPSDASKRVREMIGTAVESGAVDALGDIGTHMSTVQERRDMMLLLDTLGQSGEDPNNVRDPAQRRLFGLSVAAKHMRSLKVMAVAQKVAMDEENQRQALELQAQRGETQMGVAGLRVGATMEEGAANRASREKIAADRLAALPPRYSRMSPDQREQAVDAEMELHHWPTRARAEAYLLGREMRTTQEAPTDLLGRGEHPAVARARARLKTALDLIQQNYGIDVKPEDQAEYDAAKKDYLEKIEASGGAAAQGAQGAGVKPAGPKVASEAEYRALPSGAVFVGPDGKRWRKP